MPDKGSPKAKDNRVSLPTPESAGSRPIEEEICAECKWSYPEDLLSAMESSDGRTAPICGICALEISNRIHGIKRDRFTGTMAEELRCDAVEWRKRTPDGPEARTPDEMAQTQPASAPADITKECGRPLAGAVRAARVVVDRVGACPSYETNVANMIARESGLVELRLAAREMAAVAKLLGTQSRDAQALLDFAKADARLVAALQRVEEL